MAPTARKIKLIPIASGKSLLLIKSEIAITDIPDITVKLNPITPVHINSPTRVLNTGKQRVITPPTQIEIVYMTEASILNGKAYTNEPIPLQIAQTDNAAEAVPSVNCFMRIKLGKYKNIIVVIRQTIRLFKQKMKYGTLNSIEHFNTLFFFCEFMTMSFGIKTTAKAQTLNDIPPCSRRQPRQPYSTMNHGKRTEKTAIPMVVPTPMST